MPTRRAQLDHVQGRIVDFLAVQEDVAGDGNVAISSFIRFRHRRSVDLPQPEGPMSAVT